MVINNLFLYPFLILYFPHIAACCKRVLTFCRKSMVVDRVYIVKQSMIKVIDNKIYRRQDKELLVIEPWGPDSLRVRATQNHTFNKDEETSALLPALASAPEITTDGKSAVITNGKIRCELMVTGKLKFFNQKGELLLEEYDRNRFRENVEGEFNSALEISPRTFTPIMGTENFKLAVRFEPNDGEKIYGMGQYQQPYMDMKGCVVELAHRNSQASVPFALSNKGYGNYTY